MAIIVDKDKKRRDIALACIDLISVHGLQNVSVEQLALEAGVGKGTIYNYFHTKESIVVEIFRSKIDEILEIIEKSNPQNYFEKLKIVFDRSQMLKEEENRLLPILLNFWGLMLINPIDEGIELMNDYQSKILSKAVTILEDGIKAGYFINVDPLSCVEMIEHSLLGIKEKKQFLKEYDIFKNIELFWINFEKLIIKEKR